MNIFEKQFATLLEADIPVEPTTIDDPEVAVDAELPTTDATTAGVIDDVSDNPGVSWRKDQNNQQRATIESWIHRVVEFTEFLNGTTTDSIQKQLAGADCDTMFNDVSKAQAKKITRIAEDLSALQQNLQGYLISSDESSE